jgi:sigma-B regulation protein RsbU (phosphoserine phosphatase)
VLSALTAGMFFALSVVIFGTKMNLATQIAVLIACTLAVRLLIQRTRKRILAWIDRRFFREAYNAQLILEDLSENVRSIVDEKQLLETVARRISESLHVPQFAVLLQGEGKFQPVYCLGLEIRSDLALPEDSRTIDVVKRSAEPPQIYFDQKDNWVYATPQTELVTLKALHAQLLLPIGQKDKLLGLLSLGPKRSEEPYSRSDIQLLRSVAAQTGLALENSRLTKTIAEEAAQRERLNREIEIAREVQQRLFPQRLPVIAGIDYSGACRPALGVAGDYYDFLALPNGNLGIAIGDVSGKGIAAALLMASLQASLRGQVLAGHTDLAQLMTNVNQLIYETTTPERYVTFFYGQYHRESRTFHYVNAGHNPPLVLRQTRDGKIHVIRLETGGPVIGAFRDVPYQQGSLTLEPGDIFVGFTDGVIEAMNPQDEEWGEERLIPAVAQNARQPAAAIIPSLLSEADRFASGAPQHDDMTLVVMKVCDTA